MSTTAETFGVPLKKASEIDLLKPLKNLITSRYQTAEQESYIGAINELVKLRSSAVCRTLDYHDSSLETLYRRVHLQTTTCNILAILHGVEDVYITPMIARFINIWSFNSLRD